MMDTYDASAFRSVEMEDQFVSFLRVSRHSACLWADRVWENLFDGRNLHLFPGEWAYSWGHPQGGQNDLPGKSQEIRMSI